MFRWWNRHFLLYEFLLAVGCTLVLAVWAVHYHGQSVIEEILTGNRGAIYGTLASILGTLLGFVITALALLVSFANTETLSPLRVSKHYSTLWGTFTSGMHFLSIATVLGVVALIFDRDANPRLIIQVLVFWAVFTSALRVARAVWILEKVVALLTVTARA